MASIDLADVYLHCFLRFSVEGLHFHFQCLPFGLCTTPRTFSKMLSAMVAALRFKGIQIFHHLDVILLLALSRSLLQENVARTGKTLKRFGWMINYQKCNVQLPQVLEYLGVQFNSALSQFFLPQRKVQEVQRWTRQVLSSLFATAR